MGESKMLVDLSLQSKNYSVFCMKFRYLFWQL